jgi:hypothetical protein
LEKSLILGANCNSISNDYALCSALNVVLLDGRRESKRDANKSEFLACVDYDFFLLIF